MTTSTPTTPHNRSKKTVFVTTTTASNRTDAPLSCSDDTSSGSNSSSSVAVMSPQELQQPEKEIRVVGYGTITTYTLKDMEDDDDDDEEITHASDDVLTEPAAATIEGMTSSYPPTPRNAQVKIPRPGTAAAAAASFHRASSVNSTGTTSRRILIKTQSTFWGDARAFTPGTIPHSMILAVLIGTVCGIAAFLYYSLLFWGLDVLWHQLPALLVVNHWSPEYYILWTPLVGLVMAVCVGLTVKYMGEPGDLPYTIKCVHDEAFVSMSHVLPMASASLFSILGGSSLGPEAPLVAICAALGGFVSRQVCGITERNLIRKHTLMGMAGALAAFFGCPLGGSLFALEVNSRFGVEYFEHTSEAILCGEVCLVVFRTLAGLPIEPIWHLTDAQSKLPNSSPLFILYGAMLGLFGAVVSWVFANFHWTIMGLFRKYHLLVNEHAVPRALCGAVVILLVGLLIPQTMFWGEFEFETIAMLAPTSTLPHIWPTNGLLDFEMNSFTTCIIVGIMKLIAISFSVSGGYRGGYIFPAFAAAAALGRAVYFVMPFIPVQLCVLCMAAALNVALTRTALATTLILSFLSGEQNALSAILASSLVSLFVTGYMPFIPSQMSRADLEFSLYYSEDYPDMEDYRHDEHEHDDELQPGYHPVVATTLPPPPPPPPCKPASHMSEPEETIPLIV